MDCQIPGVGAVDSAVPPTSAQEPRVATSAPAGAVNTTPKSLSASIPQTVTFSVNRKPGAAWCRESCSAPNLKTAGGTFVQNARDALGAVGNSG